MIQLIQETLKTSVCHYINLKYIVDATFLSITITIIAYLEIKSTIGVCTQFSICYNIIVQLHPSNTP